jgi:hypothetical protein
MAAPPTGGALLDARLTAIEAAIAPLAPIPAQLAAMQLQLNNIAAALGVAGVGAAADQARAAARRANAVASDAPLVIVSTAAGGVPAAWPAGLDRAALWVLPGAAANALLIDYALPAGGSIEGRRMRLARHTGAPA